MTRCLFTDAELVKPLGLNIRFGASLGGRIRSRAVSSDAFNERCGGLIDTYIRNVYADTMAILGPALPVPAAGDQAVRIPGQPGRYIIDGQGEPYHAWGSGHRSRPRDEPAKSGTRG